MEKLKTPWQKIPRSAREGIKGIIPVESITNEAYNKDTTAYDRIVARNRRYKQGEVKARDFFAN